MITLLVATACLFVLGLLFGRRFGVLTLALAAGLVISGYMSATVAAVSGPYVGEYVTYVPAAITLLPALALLLFAKGRHRRIASRVINAALFAAAGLVFLIASPGTPASLTGDFAPIRDNLGLIMTGLLGLAILETAFGKPSKKKVEEAKK